MKRINTNINFVNLFIVVSLLAACSSDTIDKPTMILENQILEAPFSEISFMASGNNWKARLNTFIQPVNLSIEYTDIGFKVIKENKDGYVEGPSLLCLQNGKHTFYYDINLKNKAGASNQIVDYRSPKTVNPDSSLTQQSIILAKDKWANIAQMEEFNFFEEKDISLPPKSGTYLAQPEIPTSAYYVQPGSCTSIVIQANYNEEQNVFHVYSDLLQDQNGNLIADGTVVNFIYYDGQFTYYREAQVFNGIAKAIVKAYDTKTHMIYARIDETVSSTIQLKIL